MRGGRGPHHLGKRHTERERERVCERERERDGGREGGREGERERPGRARAYFPKPQTINPKP